MQCQETRKRDLVDLGEAATLERHDFALFHEHPILGQSHALVEQETRLNAGVLRRA
jgi:hypothetical protein